MESRNDMREGRAAGSPREAAQTGPIRRIGSTTLGVVLIVCGICLLLHYFWPGFDYLLAVKLSPVFLILMGGEVLYFAARPEKGRYDFLSIFGCLLLIGCVFCISMLPAIWDYIGPEREAAEERLEAQIEQQLYGMLKGSDISTLNVRLRFNFDQAEGKTLAGLDGSEEIRVSAELMGPYENAEEFAAQCRRVADAVRQLTVTVDRIDFSWEIQGDETQEWAERSAYLLLESPYQLDWDAAVMADHTVWLEESKPLDDWDGDEAPDDEIPDENGGQGDFPALPEPSEEPDTSEMPEPPQEL